MYNPAQKVEINGCHSGKFYWLQKFITKNYVITCNARNMLKITDVKTFEFHSMPIVLCLQFSIKSKCSFTIIL